MQGTVCGRDRKETDERADSHRNTLFMLGSSEGQTIAAQVSGGRSRTRSIRRRRQTRGKKAEKDRQRGRERGIDRYTERQKHRGSQTGVGRIKCARDMETKKRNRKGDTERYRRWGRRERLRRKSACP